jgi:hypothetical protein
VVVSFSLGSKVTIFPLGIMATTSVIILGTTFASIRGCCSYAKAPELFLSADVSYHIMVDSSTNHQFLPTYSK